MLILTRKIGERIIIGDREIVVVVLNTVGDSVKLGFESGNKVQIDREEVFLEKQKKNRLSGNR